MCDKQGESLSKVSHKTIKRTAKNTLTFRKFVLKLLHKTYVLITVHFTRAALTKLAFRGGQHAPYSFLPVSLCFSIILWNFIHLPGASHMQPIKEMALRHERQLTID